MPKYMMLTTLTPKGLQTLQSNPDRLKEVNRDVEELGAQVLHQWCMVGAYDFVNIIEASDAATIARVSVALGARGSAKVQSFELVEIDDLLAQLSA
ncbi:MAG TPA: GYD domain-containing protein [Gaiellaceae bacterium]|nr:GYD domain-containing protein [Gaiellaceae bacterium]